MKKKNLVRIIGAGLVGLAAAASGAYYALKVYSPDFRDCNAPIPIFNFDKSFEPLGKTLTAINSVLEENSKQYSLEDFKKVLGKDRLEDISE